MKDAKRLARNLTILYAVALAITHSIAFLIFAGFLFALAAFVGYSALKRGRRFFVQTARQQGKRQTAVRSLLPAFGVVGPENAPQYDDFSQCPHCGSWNTEPHGNTSMHCLDCGRNYP
jgi:hypothetical protein